MGQHQCQKEHGGVLKALAPSGISFLRLFPIKIALFHEKSRRRFCQNGGFQLFSEKFCCQMYEEMGQNEPGRLVKAVAPIWDEFTSTFFH